MPWAAKPGDAPHRDALTMLKGGSGWGALAAVSAADLAKDGVTGAPAITIEAAK
jgi:2-methylcitrate dehydratase PrpD